MPSITARKIGSNITGIVLCGGKSRRMGTNKGDLRLGQTPLMEMAAQKLSVVCKTVVISANETRENELNLPILKDIEKNKGPLGGIQASLQTSQCPWCLFVPCDLPFISETLLRQMVKKFSGEDCYVLKVADKLQPLVGIYSTKLLPIITSKLKNNQLKMHSFLKEVQAGYYEPTNKFMKENPHLLMNINSPKDLLEARSILFPNT